MADTGSSEPAPAPVGPGRLVLIVGPSGAGKDSVIAAVRTELERRGDTSFVFPTRIVTRTAHAAEANAAISADEYEAARAVGAFALSWLAHGLAYAIPAAIDDDIRAGRSVVVNVSRAVVTKARERYLDVRVMLIDAPVAIRADRLATRGRETRAEIEGRLLRAVSAFAPGDADIIIDNAGRLEDAVARALIDLIAR